MALGFLRVILQSEYWNLEDNGKKPLESEGKTISNLKFYTQPNDPSNLIKEKQNLQIDKISLNLSLRTS